MIKTTTRVSNGKHYVAKLSKLNNKLAVILEYPDGTLIEEVQGIGGYADTTKLEDRDIYIGGLNGDIDGVRLLVGNVGKNKKVRKTVFCSDHHEYVQRGFLRLYPLI